VDEDFNNDIWRGVVRRAPHVDIVRVQDVGLREHSDQDVLTWAARENRVLLTHDVRTMTRQARERVAAGLAMPGVMEVPRYRLMGEMIEQIVLWAEVGEPHDMENLVRFL
jgi:hypothetical protein